MNTYGWPNDATWLDMQQVYATMANPLLSEQEKFSGTGLEGMSELVGYNRSMIYYLFVPLSIVWLVALLVRVFAGFWKTDKLMSAYRGTQYAEYLAQLVFGLIGPFLLFFTQSADFRAVLSDNLMALTVMTILLTFFANGFSVLCHWFAVDTIEALHRDTTHNYVWIGLMLIATTGGDGTTMGGGSTPNAMLQLFAGVAFMAASRVAPQAVNNDAEKNPWFFRRDAGKYALLSIAAVLMLCINPRRPLQFLLRNRSLQHPWYAFLIFMWTWLSLQVVVQVVSAGCACKHSPFGKTSKKSSSSKKSSRSSSSSCCSRSCCESCLEE